MPIEPHLDAPIYVVGHGGLVGSAVMRRLESAGHTNLLTATREQLDLRDQAEVSHWFKANRPEYVLLVAGTVGGIMANSTRPAEFIYDNMMIHGTVVQASYEYKVRKLLYLGSSCMYPRGAEQPIDEEQLLTGPLEPTNEAYAIAKIAGINLHINVGTGVDLSIRDLASVIREIVYPSAEVVFDISKPDGTTRKVLNTLRLAALGWSPSIPLVSGLRSTYDWFLASTALRGLDDGATHAVAAL